MARHLTPKQTVDEATKIIGSSCRKDEVEAELYHVNTASAALERLHSRASKSSIRPVKQFGAALRKARGELHEDLRLVLGIDALITIVEAYEKYVGTDAVTTNEGDTLHQSMAVALAAVAEEAERAAKQARIAAGAAKTDAEVWTLHKSRIQPRKPKRDGGALRPVHRL